jgi:hypothetical protein
LPTLFVPIKSLALELYLKPYKEAAGEGAAVELQMRLLAGAIPALQRYAHGELWEIETDLSAHFAALLSDEDKETLRLCRQLRNRVLHSDFRAARDKLRELGIDTTPGGVVKIDLPEPTKAEASRKILAALEGREGTPVSDLPSKEVCGLVPRRGQSRRFRESKRSLQEGSSDNRSVSPITRAVGRGHFL